MGMGPARLLNLLCLVGPRWISLDPSNVLIARVRGIKRGDRLDELRRKGERLLNWPKKRGVAGAENRESIQLDPVSLRLLKR